MSNRDHRPHMRPVIKAELSEKNLKLRLVLTAIFLLLGVIAISMAVKGLLSTNEGWTTISANASSDAKNSNEFVFMYELGSGETSATAEKKALTLLYTEALEENCKLFDDDAGYADVKNMYYINHHPGEVIEVDDMLYHAFEVAEQYGNRNLYLAPIYKAYDDLFYSEYDEAAAELDPYKQESLRTYFGEIADFASDRDAVNVELLGDGQICLHVSEEYQTYAQENQIESYVDFFWMKNAFIVDNLAQTLVDAGYTHGSISSFDGFGRCLDERENSFSLNIFTRRDNTVYQAGTYSYQGPMSMVTLRDYMITERDILYYYAYADGETRTSYLSTDTGLCESSISNLTCYSKDAGCAEILMQMSPVYIADAFSEDALMQLTNYGIYSIYCMDFDICCNEPDAVFYDIYEKDGTAFTLNIKK